MNSGLTKTLADLENEVSDLRDYIEILHREYISLGGPVKRYDLTPFPLLGDEVESVKLAHALIEDGEVDDGTGLVLPALVDIIVRLTGINPETGEPC